MAGIRIGGMTATRRPFLEVAGVVRPSRDKPSSGFGRLNRSDFKIERDHFMYCNRGHIDDDEAVLFRDRNLLACHQ